MRDEENSLPKRNRLKSKKPSSPQRRNEGIHNCRTKQMPGLASSFSLSEKWTRGETRGVGRAQSNRYPDFRASNLAPAFPTSFAKPVSGNGSSYPVTVAQPSPNHTGFPGHLIANFGRTIPASLSKNKAVLNRKKIFASDFRRLFKKQSLLCRPLRQVDFVFRQTKEGGSFVIPKRN